MDEQHEEDVLADQSKENPTARRSWGDREEESEDEGMLSDLTGWKFVLFK